MTILKPSGNFTGGLRRFKPFGNFTLPDCTFASVFTVVWAQETTAASTVKKIIYRLGVTPPTAKEVLRLWRVFAAQAGYDAAKMGAFPADALDFLKRNGVVDDWATLNISPGVTGADGLSGDDRLHANLALFRGLMLAGELTQRAYQNTPRGFVWRLFPGDAPTPTLGHAVANLAYKKGFDGIVTWALFGWMTSEFRQACFNAAYVFVIPAQRGDADYGAKLARIAALQINQQA